MPILDRPLTKADYDGAYHLPGERDGHPSDREGVWLSYHRYVVLPTLDKDWRALTEKLGAPMRVLIVGAGFGWGSECLQSHAPGCQVIGTDVSGWIQAAKAQTEETDLRARIEAVGLDSSRGRGQELLQRFFDGGPRARTAVEDEPLTDGASRTSIRQTLGVSDFEYVVSEDVIACLSDASVIALAQNMDRLNPTSAIIHTVTPRSETTPSSPSRPRQDPGYNWKSLAEWRELLNANGLSHHKLIRAQIKNEEIV